MARKLIVGDTVYTPPSASIPLPADPKDEPCAGCGHPTRMHRRLHAAARHLYCTQCTCRDGRVRLREVGGGALVESESLHPIGVIGTNTAVVSDLVPLGTSEWSNRPEISLREWSASLLCTCRHRLSEHFFGTQRGCLHPIALGGAAVCTCTEFTPMLAPCAQCGESGAHASTCPQHPDYRPPSPPDRVLDRALPSFFQRLRRAILNEIDLPSDDDGE